MGHQLFSLPLNRICPCLLYVHEFEWSSIKLVEYQDDPAAEFDQYIKDMSIGLALFKVVDSSQEYFSFITLVTLRSIMLTPLL